tara:strand:+ start:615 stop:827 length:213 start_codon:yes stop_codon:yes gene_type:complete
MNISFIIHDFIEGERTIGVAETLAAEAIAHQMNNLRWGVLGGGTIRTKPVKLLTLKDVEGIREFIEDHAA